jgi:tripartite-type tricarboxylate transporter receptor subunit TctC
MADSQRPVPAHIRGRRRTLQTLGALAAATLGVGHAQTAAWPTRPIKLVLPSGAGGGSDIFGRPLGDWLAKELGQPVVVENKPGANGVIAHEAVIRQPGDGYNLVISFAAAVLGNKAMNAKIPHDTIADLKPIGLIGGEGGNLLICNPALPFQNVRDMLAYSRTQNGGLNYGSWGVGSGGHLVMETLQEKTGVPLNHVPYKTVAAIPPDVVSGTLPVSTIDSGTPVALIKAGRLRAVAAMSPARLPQLPDVPTMGEQGYPVGFVPWYGLFGPASMPADMVNRLNGLLNKWLVLPDTAALFEQKQNSPAPKPKSAEAFAAQIQAELPVWRQMMKTAKIEGA